jgi:hypothetical protein
LVLGTLYLFECPKRDLGVKQALDPLLVPLQAQTSVTPKLLSMKASVGDLYSHLLYLYS